MNMFLHYIQKIYKTNSADELEMMEDMIEKDIKDRTERLILQKRILAKKYGK